MPSVENNDKFVFDTLNKTLKLLTTGSTSFVTMGVDFSPPYNLKYTVTGNEEGLLWYFKHKNVFYAVTLGSTPSAGDIITFDTESKVMSRIHNATVTALNPIMSENAPFNLEYDATGSETEGELVYLEYDGVFYLFELPSLTSGEKIVFNPDSKALQRIRNNNAFAIYKKTVISAPKYMSYQYQSSETAGDVYYFRYRDYRYRYCAFVMPDGQQVTFDGFVFYPDSGELFYTDSGVLTALECTITDTAPTGTNITSSMTETTYGTNITALFNNKVKGLDITSSLASLAKDAEDITDDFNSMQMEATDLTSSIVSGMPPHSIEIVVEGGDSAEIAQQILNNKAGGITTYGSISVPIATSYGEEVTVNFNRPIKTYVWFKLSLTLRSNEQLPDNYANLLKNAILEQIESLNSGDDVVPQEFMSELYDACTGIAYIDISLFGTNVEGATPASYPSRIIEISDRQRAYTTASMIEVVIPNG